MFKRNLQVLRLGLKDYGQVLKLQESLAACLSLSPSSLPTLIVCQHFPVYTMGKRNTEHNLLEGARTLKELGKAQIFHSLRGGDITFHGPGQLVLYPILHLRSMKLGARKYVEGLEDVMIQTAKRYGLLANGRMIHETGVWVGDRKIGAVGVRINGGVSSHGIAFNATTELCYFDHIIPCGIVGKGVTSLERELGRSKIDLEEVEEELVKQFSNVFGFMTCSGSMENNTEQ